MKPNNNSDNDLLVWADWLDENGYEQIAEDIRDEVENPVPDVPWQYVGGIVVGNVVGGFGSVVGGFGGVGGGN